MVSPELEGDEEHGWSWDDCHNFAWSSNEIPGQLTGYLQDAVPGSPGVELHCDDAVMLDGGTSTQFYWRRIQPDDDPVERAWPDNAIAVPDYVQSGAPNSSTWPPEPAEP